jgi:hypothetical protein
VIRDVEKIVEVAVPTTRIETVEVHKEVPVFSERLIEIEKVIERPVDSVRYET